MVPDGRGRARLDYRIPARGLIGFQGEFMNLTRGNGILSHVFDDYGPWKGEMPGRRNGAMVSQEDGVAVGYALFNLQERGRAVGSPGDKGQEGMGVGVPCRRQGPGGDTIEIGLDPATLDIRTLRLTDQLGNVTYLSFTEMKTGVALDDNMFTFTPPAGVDIVKAPPAPPH